jgi:hypothetical protein
MIRFMPDLVSTGFSFMEHILPPPASAVNVLGEVMRNETHLACPELVEGLPLDAPLDQHNNAPYCADEESNRTDHNRDQEKNRFFNAQQGGEQVVKNSADHEEHGRTGGQQQKELEIEL